MSQLESKIKLAQETLNYQKILLDRSTIYSPAEGVAVLQDKSLLIGKPYNIGENIMVVANPSLVEVNIFMPVKDSITIEKNANINVFLDSDPMNVIKAKVTKFSYEPEMTSQNILAYRVTAKLIADNIYPRIGLRGSAKIYGDQVNKISVISFNLSNHHPSDIGSILDQFGIAVRTGQHCTQPIMDFYKIPGTVRVSLSFYNTKSEIDLLIDALEKASTMLG